MYRIVYISRSIKSWYDVELEELALDCAARNRGCQVTGLLLYDGLSFMQAIEGPEDAIKATMARIANDSRHTAVSFFAKGPATERQFGDWAMRYKRAPVGCCSEEFLNSIREQIDRVDDHHVRAAFIGFAALGSRRPKDYVCGTA